MNSYLRVMSDYAKFDGRLRRRDYWLFVLFSIGVVLLSAFLGVLLLGEEFGFIPYVLVVLAHVFPWIAANVRRLHDIGKSGSWWFIRFVPVIGGIWFLILTLMESQPGANQF